MTQKPKNPVFPKIENVELTDLEIDQSEREHERRYGTPGREWKGHSE